MNIKYSKMKIENITITYFMTVFHRIRQKPLCLPIDDTEKLRVYIYI